MLFTESELRARVALRSALAAKSVQESLRESRDPARTGFDIFLSHSIIDSELILGAKLRLEEFGFSVYVDWHSDPKLDRSRVSPTTANHLRVRMKQCFMLVYVHTLNSSLSKWCPWELGYFDGLKGGNVFIMPIANVSEHSFVGQEYLGLYPYLEPALASKNIKIEATVDGLHFLQEARTKTFRRKVG